MTKLSARTLMANSDIDISKMFFHMYKEGAPNLSFRVASPVLTEMPNYVIPQITNNAADNGTNLLAAYVFAQSLTPNGVALSASNRGAVLLLPGEYFMEVGALVLDTPFIDIIGIGAKDSIVINSGSGNTLAQTADDVHIKNITIKTISAIATDFAYYPDTALPNTILEDILFDASGNSNPTRKDIDYSGRYINCGYQNDNLFGGGTTTICSGTFIDCTGGNNSFGIVSSGTFKRCIAVNNSFGGGTAGGTANGTFTDCTGGTDSFGDTEAFGAFTRCTAGVDSFGISGDASGDFTDCTSGNNSFGLNAGGNFTRCTAGTGSFGGAATGTANGIFKDCKASDNSFGYVSANGTFTRCDGGANCFGGVAAGIANGTFTDCTGGNDCFGKASADGAFNYCTGLLNCFGSGGTVAGTFTHCVGGSQSFAGNGGAFQGAVIHCKMRGTEWGGSFSGLMDTCVWVVTGADKTALNNVNGIVYSSTLIGTGTGKSIGETAASSLVATHCRTNKTITVTALTNSDNYDNAAITYDF